MIAIVALPAEARTATAGDRPPPPKLPLAEWWTITLDGSVSAGPVSDGPRVYLAYAAGFLVAHDAADGHELWRQKKNVTLPMVAAADLLVISSADAIEGVRGASGASAWIVPRVKTVAPLVAEGGLVIATTAAELVAIRAGTGQIAWRRPAGGITLAPAIADDHLYAGASDGRVLAVALADGAELWTQFFSGGVTAIAAHGGRVYIGTGEKRLYSADASNGKPRPAFFRLGAFAIGHVAVDDERVYVAALDNVIRALDRQTLNQRWQAPMRERPAFGVFVSGHVVFAPAGTNGLEMLWDRNGRHSGSLALPGEAAPGLSPAVVDSPAGPVVFAITGGLTNEWHLTKFAPADTAVMPFARLDAMPGLPFLTDPELKPLATVLRQLILGDPPLQPLADIDWPIVLRDPPLVPLSTLTALPGLQLRQLSPVLPVRREPRAPID